MPSALPSQLDVCIPRGFSAGVAHSAAVALLVLLAWAQPADAALYKWTDANGRVVYSDQPPISDLKSEIVRGASPPSNPNALKEMAAKEVELKKRQTDGVDAVRKAETQRADVAKRSQQCTRAHEQIRQLSAEQIGLARVNGKGELVYMDETQRRKERAEAEAWIKENCAGV